MMRWSTLGAVLLFCGAGCKSNGESAAPAPRKPPPPSVTAVAFGAAFACGLLDDRTVRCWGVNNDGQLGDGTREARGQPTLVSGAGDVVEIAAGARHACARLKDGSVLCWGANEGGQLGDGTHERRTAPAEVIDVHDATGVTASGDITCVTTKTKRKEPLCFGPGAWVAPSAGCALGGDAGMTCAASDAGAPFDGLRDAVVLARFSTAERGCAVVRDGSIACWGDGAWSGVRGPACARPFVRYVRVDRFVPL